MMWAITKRFLSLCLCFALILPNISAQELDVVVVTKNEKTKRLAERMESYGYFKSALHYYKMLQQQTDLNDVERKEVEQKINNVQAKLDQKYAKNNLPDLDEMLHIETVDSKPMEQVTTERPEAFPKTRINKKKWIIGTIVVIGVSLIAYHVNRHLREKEDQQSTTTVTF